MKNTYIVIGVIAAITIGGVLGYLSVTLPKADTPASPEPAAESTARPTPDADPDGDGVSGLTMHVVPTLSPARRSANEAADPLRAAIDAVLGEGERGGRKLTAIQIREDEGSISVTWKADDHFTPSFIRTLIQQDALEIARVVDRGDVPYRWLFLAATYPVSGEDEEEVFIASFTESGIDRLDMNTMTHGRFVDTAESVFWHSAMQD